MIDQDERAKRLITSNVRWRAIFVLLAVLVPLLLHVLFERQARRLEALADHGETTNATVESIEQQGSDTFVTYRYSVGSESYTWSVGQEDAPHGIGESFAVIYLPEAPALTRPFTDRSRARLEAASNRRFTWKLVIGAFGFFVVCAALSEKNLRRLRERRGVKDGRSGSRISPVWIGRLLALLILAVIISTNFYADVSEVQRKAFGEAPMGVPVSWFVSIAEVFLLAPFYWVIQHLYLVASYAIRDRAWLSSTGLALYLLRAPAKHPELRRSRAICLAGLVYLAVLFGGWIAFTQSRGL